MNTVELLAGKLAVDLKRLDSLEHLPEEDDDALLATARLVIELTDELSAQGEYFWSMSFASPNKT